MIYLDYAANFPADPAVLERFCAVERAYPGNPNAIHPAGQAARQELARVTASVAGLLGVSPGQVIYTSGATESNNLALKGIAHASRGRHILTTPLEHASVRATLAALAGEGYEVEELPLEPNGQVSLTQLAARLRPETILVAVCAVDSELGAVQPIEGIAALLAGYPNCRLHVDATQAVGKCPLSLAGADTVSLSAHKFGGLNGSGLLLKARRLELAPLFHGGSSTTPYRSGTPCLALAAATELALRQALESQAAHTRTVEALSRFLRSQLAARPGVRFNSPPDGLPHILNLSVEGIKATRLQRALGEEGVCVSVQSACATAGTPSHAVMAMTHSPRNALSSWRISLSHLTTRQELEEFLAAFDRCLSRLDGQPRSTLGGSPE